MNSVGYKRIGVVGRAVGLLLALVSVAVWGLFLSWALPAAAQGDSGRTIVNQNLVVEKGEVIKGDVVVTNGNLTLQGAVHGDVVVAKGDADIEGTVEGNVTVTDGTVKLGPGSLVDGDVLAVVGQIVRDPHATVNGNVNAPGISLEGVSNSVFAAPDVPKGAPEPARLSAPSWLPDGILSSFLNFFSKGMVSLVLLVVGLLLAALLPTRVGISSATLETEPVPSLIVGLITALLLFPVTVLLIIVLAISIVGALFIPVVILVLGVALLFGLVTVSAWIGRIVYETTHGGAPHTTQHLVINVLLGMSILLGTTFVPSVLLPGAITGIMLALMYLASSVGIAALILSRLGTLAPPKHRDHYRQVHIYGAPRAGGYGPEQYPAPAPGPGANQLADPLAAPGAGPQSPPAEG